MAKKTKKTGRGHGQRKLRIEALERRAMLAGNVTVSVSGGTLNIRGDGEDNAIFVSEVEQGVYAVVGFDDLEGNPTFVNGDENGVVVIGGVTRDINIDLKGGDDLLAIGNDEGDLLDLIAECELNFGEENEDPEIESLLEVVPEGSQTFVPRDLIIRTGDGNDQVALIVAVSRTANINLGQHDDAIAVGDSQFGDDLIIKTDKGFDFVCVVDNVVGDQLNIQTGDDSDAVHVEGLEADNALIDTGKGHDEVGFFEASLDRTLSIKTGDGDDVVELEEFELGDDLLVDTGAGADSVFADSFIAADLVKVVTGSGDDPDVELSSFNAKNVLIDTGSGNDGTDDDRSPITVENASVEQDIKIFTGSGFDLVDVFFVEARDIVIDTGSHDDDVLIVDIALERDLKIVTGSGRDFVVVASEEFGVEVGRDLLIDAGSDTDEVIVDGAEIGRNALILLGSNSPASNNGQSMEVSEYLSIENVLVAGNAKIDAGSGDDIVLIDDSNVGGKFTAIMGSGNDFLRICNSFAATALLDGGSGKEDVLQSELDINNLPPGYTVKNFEDYLACEVQPE
jgi:hypothetical protein